MLFTIGLIPVVNLVIGLVCLSKPISAGRNFLIVGMMMGYDLGMMPVVSKFWYCLVSQMHTQKCMFLKRFQCYKDTQQQIHLVLSSPMFVHYIRLVLAAHTGWFKKCFILVLVGVYAWWLEMVQNHLHKLINKYLKTIIFSYRIQTKGLLVRVK